MTKQFKRRTEKMTLDFQKDELSYRDQLTLEKVPSRSLRICVRKSNSWFPLCLSRQRWTSWSRRRATWWARSGRSRLPSRRKEFRTITWESRQTYADAMLASLQLDPTCGHSEPAFVDSRWSKPCRTRSWSSEGRRQKQTTGRCLRWGQRSFTRWKEELRWSPLRRRTVRVHALCFPKNEKRWWEWYICVLRWAKPQRV